ncbi:hypothetical protein [Enterobacter sp. R1(2018)]|uniref:hypothetical protein n=1 Tax=Enterobacter sp. R1(2018) TaxID=2447891 RepID=UPI000EAD0C24|nr:hypothetical protein [Enterobacter sp. R1(2018)]RKQ38373.1 hypothetical protein D8M09_17360 [Enterobacter sp. R1(2018)]
MESKSREQFEAWFNPKKESMKSCGLGMMHIRRTHDIAWESWLASRAAIVVELPEMLDYELLDEKSVKASMRAAGITVKGEGDGKA